VDRSYYQSRLASALASAKAAVEPCARIAHETMARAYRVLLHDAHRSGQRERQQQTQQATEEWENEGGRPR
jgi:hypothetical protein